MQNIKIAKLISNGAYPESERDCWQYRNNDR